MTDSNDSLGGLPGRRTSIGLLERARDKLPGSWERLLELYEPLVLYWCRRAGLQEADAFDLKQEVFLAVSANLADFKPQRTNGSFRAWLRSITRNKVVDRWRSQDDAVGRGGSNGYRMLLQFPGDDAVSSDGSLSDERRLLYRQALELIQREFETQTWQVFWRAVIDQVRPSDIAAEFGITVNIVYLAKSRVLARLREEFINLIDE